MNTGPKTVLLAAVAVLAAPVVLGSAAYAQRTSNINGDKLAGICTSRDARQVEGCEAYVTAVTDSATAYQKLRPADSGPGALPGYICIPGQVTGAQLRQQYVGWMRNHRDQGERVAAGTVLSAMLDLYPCK